MELYYYGLTDTGNLRDNNEDYLFAGKLKKDEYLFIVADGMGGHEAGEVASRKAVSMFVRQLEQEKNITSNENSTYIQESLKRIVIDINDTLIREGSRSHKKNGMGTTFSALYIKKNQGYIIHVGDSRIYLFSPSLTHAGNIDASATPVETSQLTRLTEDHSFVGKLVKDGLITEEEARSHPKRNVLFQSIGIKKDITIQTKGPIPIKTGQKYLVCSDGLHGVVPDNEIEEYLQDKSTAQIAEALVKRAKFNGGPDNISVIVISTEPDVTIDLPDTVKITTSPPQKRGKNRVWFFILLGLLVLLLALIIYILLMTNGPKPSPPPTIPQKDITQTKKPIGTDVQGSEAGNQITNR
ncbi:MAG: protein phosphatase 2C domain-containing protein [Candidatus Aminicenantes bacterium]|jgi:protein phosphatase